MRAVLFLLKGLISETINNLVQTSTDASTAIEFLLEQPLMQADSLTTDNMIHQQIRIDTLPTNEDCTFKQSDDGALFDTGDPYRDNMRKVL